MLVGLRVERYQQLFLTILLGDVAYTLDDKHQKCKAAILDFILENILQPDALPATNNLSARLVEHLEEHDE